MNEDGKKTDLHTYDPRYNVLATEVMTRIVGDKFVVRIGGKLKLGSVGLLFGLPYSLS